MHFVTETVDQGPIIIQAAVPVYRDDTKETLSSRILEQEHLILPQAIQFIAEDRLEIRDRKVFLKDENIAHASNVMISPQRGHNS